MRGIIYAASIDISHSRQLKMAFAHGVLEPVSAFMAGGGFEAHLDRRFFSSVAMNAFAGIVRILVCFTVFS